MRRLAPLAAAGLALVLASLPVAQAQNGFAGVDPGTVQDIDLAGALLGDKLPFDVQFFLRAKVAASVTRVSGRFFDSRRPVNCLLELYPSEPKDYGRVKILLDNRDGSGLKELQQIFADPSRTLSERKITELGWAEPTNNEELGRVVVLSVPGLRPNRFHCFEFQIVSGVSEEDERKFRAAAAAALEQELRNPYYTAPTADPAAGQDPACIKRRAENDPERYQQLRLKLIDTVEGLLTRGRAIVTGDAPFFARSLGLRELDQAGGTAYRAEFDRILEAQVQKYDAICSFNRVTAPAFSRPLADLSASDAYSTLKANLSSARVTRPLVDAFLQDKDNAFSLTGLSEIEVQSRVLGFDVTSSARQNLLNVWQADELTGRLSSLGDTLAALQSLVRIVDQVQSSADLRQLAQLDETRVRELSATARSAFETVFAARAFLAQLQETLTVRQERIEAWLERVQTELTETVTLQGSTFADYETRSSRYLSADLGGGWAPDIDKVFTYAGINFYFRPVNKKAPLIWSHLFKRGQRLNELGKRFSLTLGVTQETLEEDGQFQNLVQGGALILGGGFRINDSFRLSAGAVFFEDADPNPLITDTKISWSPFISASIDWNLRKQLARLSGAFGPATQEED